MPDLGLLSPDGIPSDLAAPGVALVVADARWLQITFEVDKTAALSLLPADVSRPIPCYARLLVVQGTTEGQGIAFASMGLGGRYRMMARNVHVGSFATTSAIGGVLTSNMESGGVALTREGQEVAANISSPGGPVATVELPSIYEVEPTMLRWDPWLTFVRTSAGTAGIGEVSVAPAIQRAYLSKGAGISLDPALPRDHLWRRLRNLLTISACYAEGELTLGAPMIQQEL